VRHLLNGPVGKPVAVTVRGEDDAEKVVSVDRAAPPGQVTTFGALPPMAADIETKTLEGGIGYVRFNIFLMPLLQPVKDAVARFAAAGAPGIVIDLRGNVGGIGMMAPSIAGTLAAKESNMGTMHLRAATMTFPINPQTPRYAGPVAILTDEASLSTSEILAGGLQELGRAVVIGRPTGGMVLPSQIERLPDGGRLQYVTADFRTPKGVLLEGKGVTPDIPVELSRETLLAHPDPTLDAAIGYIQKKSAAAAPAAAAVAQEKKP
jgi:carboxyl-terminal processing protease